MEKELEKIREQIEWGAENLEDATDNIEPEQIEWLIEQAEKLEKIAVAWVGIENSSNEGSEDFFDEVQDILSEFQKGN